MSLRRRSTKLLVSFATVVALFASALAGAAVAANSFTDVSPTSPFAADIEWLAQTGITTGYADGTFRPGAPVTRQAMAAYLRRMASGREVVQVSQNFSGVWFPRVTIDCPTGKVPTGGGGYASGGNVVMSASYLSNSVAQQSASGSSWTVTFDTETIYSGTVVGYVICDWAP